MKLTKIRLNELSTAGLNERELCRLWAGGDPGCCQCGCHYLDSNGCSLTHSNAAANNYYGYTSDPGAEPCCQT